MVEDLDKSHNLSPEQQKELLVDLLSRGEESVYPLSLAQQRLWFLDQLEPGSAAYNVPFGLRLRGYLNIDALLLSVREIVRRHAILRTRFRVDSGNPVQVVGSDCGLEIPVLALTDCLSGIPEVDAYRAASAETRIPFNLATGPLLRLKLVRLGAEEHILVCVMHHIVCDGWSLGIFTRELATLYDHFNGEVPCNLVDPPIQYGDYAAWQREWTAGHFLSHHMRYWKQALTGAPAYLELPGDSTRPEQQTFDGASYAIPLPKQLILDLTAMGSGQQATMFMVMLSTFTVLLHCYTGVEDVIVGIPATSRNRVELEDLIGFFVNTLVLRTNLSGDPRFGELLLQTRDVAIGAFSHADLPFEKLVEELNPPRVMNRNPIFQIMFSHLKVGGTPQFGGLACNPYVVGSGSSPFDLSMNFIEEAGESWWLRAEYNSAIFRQERIIRLLKDYATLLDAVAVQPELRIAELASLLHTEEGAAAHHTPSRSQDGPQPAHLTSDRPWYSRSLDRSKPHDAQQQILARIWERTLGVSNIGIHDDFFDLGGHSLLAAQLTAEMQSALGCNVPLSALFRHSTIASLLEFASEGKPWAPDPVLIEVQAGRGGFPIFGIAAPGVDTLGYALLVRHMGMDQAFYKLQAYRPTFSDLPYSTEELQKLAREYTAAMRALQPEGPYFLGAMCGGVHIAEQMVLQLEAHGHEVGLLTIIDTWVLQNRMVRWLERIHYYSHRFRHLVNMSLPAQLAFYRRWVQKQLRNPIGRDDKPADPWVNVYWPGKEFQPQRFSAPVLLFKRPRQPYYCVNDPELGWGQRSTQPLDVYTVDAAHEAMLREPSVQRIAEKWQSTVHRIAEEYRQRGGQARKPAVAAADDDRIGSGTRFAT